MKEAVSKFQKTIFVMLLYATGYFGLLIDFAKIPRTGFYVVFDCIIATLGVLSISSFRSKLILPILFLLICFFFNMSYSEAPTASSLNGFREILVIIFIVLFYNKVFNQGEETVEEYVQIVKKYATTFLIVQIPLTAYQFSQYGASDMVGGSYGGAGTGMLSMTILCFIFFLSDDVKTLPRRGLLYLGMIPLFLNETKISFILIPITILFIHFKPKLKNVLAAVGAAVFFLFVFNLYYSNQGKDFGDSNIKGVFSSDYFDDYLFGDIYFSGDIPRFTKIFIAWQLVQEQITTFLFGIEYGMFKGGQLVPDTPFAQRYEWLLNGTRPYLFYLLMQGGIMLVAGVFWLLLQINNWFRKINKFNLYLFVLFLIILVYHETFRSQGFSVVYFFLAFYANSQTYLKRAAKTIQF